MKRVLIAPATLAGVQGGYFDTLKQAGFDMIFPPHMHQLTEAELFEQLRDMDAALAGSEPYTRRVLQAHPRLKVIARVGVGYDAVDVAAATEAGVAVAVTPGTNHDAVAELTFTLILALAKNLIPAHLGTVALHWPRRANLPLRGRTLGIAGFGRIGKAVALRGLCFQMPVIAYDPYPDTVFAQAHGIRLVSWEELLRQSDWLSLHLPATPETRHLMNRSTLAKMKPGAFLINTARGAIVNEADLVEALQRKALAGAGLDVFEQEPPKDSPLFHMDNVVVTPHAAGVDLQSRDDMALSAAQTIVALSRGEWPTENIVNRPATPRPWA